MKHIYTTKEVASQFKLNVNYVRVLAKNYLKKEKFGTSYMFTKHDIAKLKELFQNH